MLELSDQEMWCCILIDHLTFMLQFHMVLELSAIFLFEQSKICVDFIII